MFSYITSMREMLISFKKTVEIFKQYLPSIESVCSCGSNILRSEFSSANPRGSVIFFFSLRNRYWYCYRSDWGGGCGEWEYYLFWDLISHPNLWIRFLGGGRWGASFMSLPAKMTSLFCWNKEDHLPYELHVHSYDLLDSVKMLKKAGTNPQKCLMLCNK